MENKIHIGICQKMIKTNSYYGGIVKMKMEKLQLITDFYEFTMSNGYF